MTITEKDTDHKGADQSTETIAVEAIAAQPTQSGQPFWQTKSLAQMTRDEWESLCDGCGRCCLQKLQTDHEHLVRYTRVACRLLDVNTCRCSNYRQRNVLVPECITLDADSIDQYSWLPDTCAYRRLNENRGLADWHPLVSGRASSVHEAGISVKPYAMSETYIHPDDFPALEIDLSGD